ncbi:MAG TPA: histidine--tRNA ligase [bacterium]|nr:histidine--tRNA ligase [bacterium]HOX85301.1 histidine--tRNA ligase [bacterium]HPG44460.1 histidine--tRNA ligase [bacterium]HPM97018.1 histidine--tRNA ligase [bacterium]
MKYQSIKGTRDVLPEEQKYWRYIEEKIGSVTSRFGYQRVEPPIFEETALFLRGVGETTDIVEKEMYTFIDKGKNSLTLRPEYTAGIMRLYLENGLHSLSKPVKLYSIGPVFRYERPQAGRYRQHTQFNVEALGEQEPSVDLEVMSVAWLLYAELGFSGLSFQLNSTGCPNCRPAYVEELKNFYRRHSEAICDDCKRRLERNPLRLLDCKVKSCQQISADAPVIHERLCEECADHFATLRLYLDTLGRPYRINHRLVRGLDYYTKTVFEVWVQGIGSQNAMCGGGRYDGLIEQLGGQATPGIGFGSGIERMILGMREQNIEPPKLPDPFIFVAHMGKAADLRAVELVTWFREAGLSALMAFGQRSFKSQMREANRLAVTYAVIVGEDEITANHATVKNLANGEQQAIPFDQVVAVLKQACERQRC